MVNGVEPSAKRNGESDERFSKPFLLGIGLNFAVFAVLTSLAWGVNHGSWSAVLFSFVAPPMSAIHFAENGDGDMFVMSFSATALAAGFILAGALKPRIAFTVLAHVSLLAYWFWSFALIGASV